MSPLERRPADEPRYQLAERCDGEALIEMRNIVKTFKNAAGEFTALKDVTTCFYQGEFVSVVGKSGSGKSTLVNMLTGIDHPTSGSVRVGKTTIHDLSENDMSHWRGRNLGIVFQFFQLMPTLTLLENVMLPMVVVDRFEPARRESRALELLKLIGLEHLADKLPAAVSGGQQQSAAIARALANDPPILIADEPTGNLDTRSADGVFDIFESLIDQGKTILMVTHDITLARRTTRSLLLSDGELINPWVAEVFPELPHTRMLWLTHRLEQKSLPAGAPVDHASAITGLALVAGGRLEVTQGTGGPQLGYLAPGDYISSFELNLNGIQLRASGEHPANLLVLEGPDFHRWLGEDPKLSRRLKGQAYDRVEAWHKASTSGGNLN
jgi:putative ABC transport system ATP-binding protein